MNYMAIAGCLPAVYCRIDPESDENREAVDKISEDFPEFKEIAEKAVLSISVVNMFHYSIR